jgi:uncharacterized protein YjbI with pentapeptide repeats
MGSERASGWPASLRYNAAVLRRAGMEGADLTRADLRGADLTGADLGADLGDARYDANTRWPAGFDPRKHGAILMT